MKIVGNLVCHNNVFEVLRAIESFLPIVDKTIVIDGGSSDGTVEVLRRFEKAYNLTILEHSYDSVDKQRNRLLDETSKDSWVIAIDPDEKFNTNATRYMRDVLLNSIDTALYTDDPKARANPLTLGVPYYRLYPDIQHVDTWRGMINTKVFYYDRNLHFVNAYHTFPTYGNQKDFVTQLNAPDDWALFHYAYLDAGRMAKVKEDIASGKREYDEKEWDLTNREYTEIPAHLL